MSRVKKTLLVIAGIVVVGASAAAALTMQENNTLDTIRAGLVPAPAETKTFHEDMVAGMPAPAQRFFLHAIEPGTPLARVAHIDMAGEINPNGQAWAPFTATQILTTRGLLWQPSGQMQGLPFSGSDHYVNNEGRMRIAVLNLIPFVNESNPDVVKAARARAVAETIQWLPSAYFYNPDARVEAIDDYHFTIIYPLDGDETKVTVTVDDQGRVVELVLPRWGNYTDDGSYAYIPFGGVSEGERRFGHYTIANQGSVGWWFGTERYNPFFRFNITSITYET